MSYVLPQVQVFQDLQRQPTVEANPLSAHIAGGHAYLARWSEEDERETASLGLYNSFTATDYAWPAQPAGSFVDQSYTKVFVKNALLRYFSDAIGTGGTTFRTSGHFNRVRSGSLTFVTANGSSRSASFYRDVRVGDVVKVAGTPTGGDFTTLWTHVTGFVPEVVAASVASAAVVAGNQATDTLEVTFAQTDGPENCIAGTASGASYNGLPAGRVTETYTVEVLQGSTGGVLSTAVLRAVSASGTDNVLSFNPSNAGVATSIGTRGLTITFTNSSDADCSESALNEDISEEDFIPGQIFEVAVAQAFTATTVTSSGTYTGTGNNTYIIEVTKGGSFGQSPEITVTTANGSDQSGPTVVTGLASATVVGTTGVRITFGGSTQGLCKGDRFTIAATAASDGAIKTLVLADNVDSTFATDDDLALDLYILVPELELSANRIGSAPLVNWTQSSDENHHGLGDHGRRRRVGQRWNTCAAPARVVKRFGLRRSLCTVSRHGYQRCQVRSTPWPTSRRSTILQVRSLRTIH
jgi:hypothetical protein